MQLVLSYLPDPELCQASRELVPGENLLMVEASKVEDSKAAWE